MKEFSHWCLRQKLPGREVNTQIISDITSCAVNTCLWHSWLLVPAPPPNDGPPSPRILQELEALLLMEGLGSWTSWSGIILKDLMWYQTPHGHFRVHTWVRSVQRAATRRTRSTSFNKASRLGASSQSGSVGTRWGTSGRSDPQSGPRGPLWCSPAGQRSPSYSQLEGWCRWPRHDEPDQNNKTQIQVHIKPGINRTALCPQKSF